ncbi:uncharacterized protein BDZ99DRAFT_565953 [Mytilinidion resinicola]|uniref:Elongation of fatty acids protein n=1 Tax=Mytilinidion resinicola TaxID=574789 RepID=A0A6A6Z4L6_9PEZI|nr:uncharacterized protein BDZ99DRAFT_565953 [Mytilinidion resinicola]KAF2816081.1 hypothetical protein BDZ99DRAFT_565953 [Mytilinidion resinicola]
MSGPSFHIKMPSHSLFKFPPDSAPPALPPPNEFSFGNPFPIPAKLYNQALSEKWPITIASIYVFTVVSINAYNRKQGNKPWAISKTWWFKAFVVLHSSFLAVYSGVTFAAMVRALSRSFPAIDNQYGIVGFTDALCKIHGPRGLGDAVTYNSSNDLWESKNRLIQLGSNNLPDSTDVGRIWNEGLAFWGWFFYLSKFYEVLDTAIILAKGKRSSTLQTYHHAGAMFCMWAGIRYMSPPIWMFVLVNSGIHTMMYTYYTVSALRYRVPQFIKRTLTTLQIAQFVVGVGFAAIHLFVSYTVPVSTPYTIFNTVRSAASALSSTIDSSLLPAATTNVGAIIKKLAYRAAGQEGLAENVRNSQGEIFGNEAGKVEETVNREIRYRNEYKEIPCIDTTGQSFAIWLNVVYLLPLTALFIRFFVRSYFKRTSVSAKHPTHHHAIAKAGHDAVHGFNRELESLGENLENGVANLASKATKNAKKSDFETPVKNAARTVKNATNSAAQKVKETQNTPSMVDEFDEKLRKTVKDGYDSPPAKRAQDMAAQYAKDGKKIPESLASKLQQALKEQKEDDPKVKAEEEEDSLLGAGDEEEGLSTTDPRDEGVSYAEKVKEEP